MKFIFLIYFLVYNSVCVASNVKTNDYSKSEIKLQLNLSLPQTHTQFKIGKPIVLSISVTNVSSELFYITDAYSQRDFKVVVKDVNGHELKSKNPEAEEEEFRRQFLPLPSNEGRVFQIDLEKYCDILVVGKYKVVVSRSFTKLNGSPRIQASSNVLEIEVVE
jgi:hypothetical protein